MLDFKILKEYEGVQKYREWWGFLGVSVVKNLPANVGDASLSPGLGRSSREGNGNPVQYSCLEILMDRGAWWATVHRAAKSWSRLSN